MADYTTPKTWTTEILTSPELNAQVRDNFIASTPIAKGTIVSGDGTSPELLVVGETDTTLVADSDETGGIRWGTPPVWIGAGSFVSGFGSPARTELTGVGGTANQGIPAWALDAAATEIVAASTLVPTGVTSTTIDFVFAMLTATSGNFLAGFVTNAFAPGESANNESGTSSPNLVVIAVPGTALEIKSQTITPDITISAGDILGINARRTGGDGTDTATGDCLFLGALIRFT